MFAIGFIACKKEADLIPPITPTSIAKVTIVKDVSQPDENIQVPAVKVTSSATVSVGSVNGTVLLGGSFKFNSFGSFVASRDVKNFTFQIEETGNVIYTSRTFASVSNGLNSLEQMATQLPKTKTFTFKFEYEVKVTATDGTGADDGEQLSVTFFYSHQNSPYDTLGPVTLQRHTYSLTTSSTVTVTRDLSDLSQSNWTFISGEEFEESKIKLISTGGTSILTALEFMVVGDPDVRNGISNVKVYEGTTPLGSAVFSSYLATVPMNFILPDAVIKTLPTHLVVGQVNDLVSAGTGAQTIELILTKVRYTDAGGTPKVIDIGLQSNKFALLKSRQVITSIPLSGVIQNGLLSDGFKFKVESIGNKSSNHQFGLDFTLTDNPTHVDTLYYKNMYVKVNNSLYTARLTNANEQIIDSIGPGTTKVFVTFVSGTGEVVTNPGPGTEFTIGGRWGGFNHPADPDNVSIELDTTRASVSYTFRYVNAGASPNNLTSKVFSSTTANAGAVRVGYIWSDYSATGHTSFLPGSGPMDAKTSSIGVKFNTIKQVWTQ